MHAHKSQQYMYIRQKVMNNECARLGYNKQHTYRLQTADLEKRVFCFASFDITFPVYWVLISKIHIGCLQWGCRTLRLSCRFHSTINVHQSIKLLTLEMYVQHWNLWLKMSYSAGLFSVMLICASIKVLSSTCHKKQFHLLSNLSYSAGTEFVKLSPTTLTICQRTCRQYRECVGFLMKWRDDSVIGDCHLLSSVVQGQYIPGSDIHESLYGRWTDYIYVLLDICI